MKFEDKILWGGLGVLVLFGVLLFFTDISHDTVNTTTSIAGSFLVLWLAFHNYHSRRISVSLLVGLLGWMLGGWVLGLLLLVLLMAFFYRAWF